MITKTHVESSEIIKGPLERTSTLGLVLLAPCPAQSAKAEIWGGGDLLGPCLSPPRFPPSPVSPRDLSQTFTARLWDVLASLETLSRRCLFGGLGTQQTRDRVTPISDVRGESSLYSFEPVDNVGNLVPMLHDPHMNFPSCSTNGQEKTLGTYEVGMLQA